jgi:hypothetical protein
MRLPGGRQAQPGVATGQSVWLGGWVIQRSLLGDLSCCNLPNPAAQMRQGRQARVAYKGSSYVKPSEDRSLGNRAYGSAYGAEPVPSRVFNTGLEPYGCEGYGLKRLWGCCGGACGRGGR